MIRQIRPKLLPEKYAFHTGFALVFMVAASVYGLSAHNAALASLDRSDVNHDGVINQIDVDLVKAAWGKNEPQYDITGDGKVDITDVSIVIKDAHL